MRINFIRITRIARLSGLALITLYFVSATGRTFTHVKAFAGVTLEDSQSSEQAAESVEIVETALLGLGRGDQLRVTVVNSNKPCGGQCVNNLKQIGIALHNYDGNMIVQSDEIAIEPGHFESFNLDRDDITLAGEAGTGRLQVLVRIRSRFSSTVDSTQTATDLIPASVEIIDKSTGKTRLLIPVVQKVRDAVIPLN